MAHKLRYLTEEDLVKGLCKGEKAAYMQLYDCHYSILCKYAQQWVRDHFIAESIVENVILRIWTSHNNFHIEKSLRHFLMRAVRNGCMDYFKRASTIHEIMMPEIDEESASNYYPEITVEDYPYGKLIEKELEDKINSAVDALPPKTKTVFKKSRFQHLKYEEIAKELGISVNTVKYHIRQSLILLHKSLKNFL